MCEREGERENATLQLCLRVYGCESFTNNFQPRNITRKVGASCHIYLGCFFVRVPTDVVKLKVLGINLPLNLL